MLLPFSWVTPSYVLWGTSEQGLAEAVGSVAPVHECWLTEDTSDRTEGLLNMGTSLI